MANDIIGAMRAAGFTVRERDPIGAPAPVLETSREISPSAQRIRLMWETMRVRARSAEELGLANRRMKEYVSNE